jgi:peptidoglycan/xylan/chitin deacetylase (PgdA/CDA1 family)
MRALLAEGHEIAANGLRHEDISGLERAEEQRRIAETTERIAAVTGQRPVGWYCLPRQGDKFAVGMISPNTMDLLREGGYEYMGNSPADDIPHYWVTDPDGPRCLLVLPYYYHFDDQFFLLFPAKGTGLENPDSLARNWRAELDAQYKRGRCFSMTLHPYAIAWPNRLQVLDTFLTYLRTLPGIWNVTGTWCARYWRQAFPPETTLRLEPSIWRDHPGSLS